MQSASDVAFFIKILLLNKPFSKPENGPDLREEGSE